MRQSASTISKVEAFIMAAKLERDGSGEVACELNEILKKSILEDQRSGTYTKDIFLDSTQREILKVVSG